MYLQMTVSTQGHKRVVVDSNTYLQLEKRNSQVRVGSNGSRNWRVMGRHKPVMSSVATNVLAKGPGASLTEREKMATMARNRY